MVIYTTIIDEQERIKLSVNLDEEDNYKPYGLGIEFTEIKDLEYPNQNLIWDNAEYIFNNFKKFLKHYIKRTILGKGIKEKYNTIDFLQILPFLTPNFAVEILEILKQAEKLKWYVKEVLQVDDDNRDQQQ